MGMPIPGAETESTESSEPPKMSSVTFADTADTSGADPVASKLETAGTFAGDAVTATELPQNDLRGEAIGNGLRTAESGFDTGESPAAGPASLLTPVMGDEAESGQPELAAAPATTMRIQREPPVQLEIGGEAAPLSTSPAESSVTAPAVRPAGPSASLGITSQPKIVGGNDAAGFDNQFASDPVAAPAAGYAALPSGNDSLPTGNDSLPAGSYSQPAGNYAQPAAATGGPASGFAQPAGGFAIPDNNAFGGNAAQPSASAQALPRLPAPSASPQGFDAPPMRTAQDLGQLPSGSNPSAMGANPSIYQGVSHRRRDDQPLPSGPTMASPGERYMDGPQSPSLLIEKRAPAEVKVGKPATFVITVKNVGRTKALGVQVHDRVPTGMTLTDATPRPNPKYQPELFWDLGDLEPSQERTITLQLTPEQEGELGSVARVTFQAASSVRTISTRPELKIVQKAPEKVLIGQQLEIELEVSNPGTGEATGVVLQEDVPAGLEHPQGKQLDNLVGDLGPGEIRRQILRMRAVKPGIVQNQIRVKGDDGLEATHTVAVEVIAPDLKATLTGPSRRYLERQATYNLEIANAGTADATNVELSVQLDRGFTFVKTDFEGQYDASRHAVFWSLPVLPVGQSGTVPLTLLPVEEGNRVLRTEASADLGVKTSTDSQVAVESLAELTFSISDTADPIEVGGQTVYEIRIQNTGSRDDTNVRVALQLPQGMQLVEQGDFTPKGQGIIEFSPRALLKANDEMVYKVKAQGTAPGRHLVKAIVTSDQSDVPVTKEESIKVYADR